MSILLNCKIFKVADYKGSTNWGFCHKDCRSRHGYASGKSTLHTNKTFKVAFLNYRVSHSVGLKVILLWSGYRF